MRTYTTAQPTTRLDVARDMARGGIITDESAVTIASWWMSPGTDGAAFSELVHTGSADLDDLRDDVRRSLDETGDDTDERDELTALMAWIDARA